MRSITTAIAGVSDFLHTLFSQTQKHAVCGPLEAAMKDMTLPEEVRREAERRLKKSPLVVIFWHFAPIVGIFTSIVLLMTVLQQIELGVVAIGACIFWLYRGRKAIKRYVYFAFWDRVSSTK